MIIGLIQSKVYRDKKTTLAHIADLIDNNIFGEVDMFILGEMCVCPYGANYFEKNSEPENGTAQLFFSELARKHSAWVVAGSIPEQDGEKLYNTSFVFDRNGTRVARHRKMHLFDINVPGGQVFKESDFFSAGNSVTVFDTEFGRVGLCVCFDFRFPELARAMAQAGAEIIVVPGAFNMTTGPAHWEILFRQRAVDEQVFTIGVAPARQTELNYISYANSIVVSPWGDVVFRAGEDEIATVVDMDLEEIAKVRNQLPLISGRRKDIFSLTVMANV